MNIDNKFKYIAIENVSNYFMKSNVVEINTSEDKIYANMNNENTSFINQIKKVKDVDDNQGNKNAINFGVAAIDLNILNLIIPFVHIVGMIIAVFGLFNSKSSEGKYASAIILNAIAFGYGIFNIFLGVILYGY